MVELNTNVDLNRLDSIHRRLEHIFRQLHRLGIDTQAVDTVNGVLRTFDTFDDENNVGYTCSTLTLVLYT